MFPTAVQFRQAEILLYLDHPAALGINVILMWLGLEATPARSLIDFRRKSAWGDYQLIITDGAKIRRIRNISCVPIINVDDFKFHEPVADFFRGTRRRFDASAFISRVQCQLDIRSKSRRGSSERDPGVINSRPS